ncbi:MAG: hypothetical protein APR63_14480 [Desulfuromonas sp. SDB]|nr:MAG: hypothetical protein APR63_14480 [Desulfuromonas sp. SDB]
MTELILSPSDIREFQQQTYDPFRFFDSIKHCLRHISGFIAGLLNRTKYSSFEVFLKRKKIEIAKCEEYMYPLEFKLKLGISLDTFNSWLNEPEIELLMDDEEFYLPPASIIDYLDKEDLHAASIKVKKTTENFVCFYFEEIGHLKGFLQFYLYKLSENNP